MNLPDSIIEAPNGGSVLWSHRKGQGSIRFDDWTADELFALWQRKQELELLDNPKHKQPDQHFHD